MHFITCHSRGVLVVPFWPSAIFCSCSRFVYMSRMAAMFLFRDITRKRALARLLQHSSVIFDP